MAVKYIPLPDSHATKRDLNFTTKAEALTVANSFQTVAFAGIIVPDPALIGDINVVEMVPQANNTQADGRKWHQIQFTRTMTIVNASNRMQDVSVPFDLNAGIVLDDEVQNPLLPWKYIAVKQGDGWTGDVERTDGH